MQTQLFALPFWRLAVMGLSQRPMEFPKMTDELDD
jgi:hypothetical protein